VTTTQQGTETPLLSQAFACGQGFDVYGEYSVGSLKGPLFDLDRVPTTTVTLLGQNFLIPTCVVAVQDTGGYYDTASSETREGLQNSLAAHAGVEVSAGAFSGEMAADYASAFQQNTRYGYVYRDFYSQLAYLTLGDAGAYISDEFDARIGELPAQVTPENAMLFAPFFSEFGVYYVQKVVLGGSLQVSSSVRSSAEMSESDMSAMVHAQYDGLFVSGSFNASVTSSRAWQAYAANMSCSIRAAGGDTGTLAALSAIDPLEASADTVALFNKWLNSVNNDPAIVDFSLDGIWNLCGDKRDAVRQAWECFGEVMHPRLTVNTLAISVPLPLPTPTPPVITLSGLEQPIQPADAPASPAGFQVTVLDSTLLGTAQAVVYDAYHVVPPGWWSVSYLSMYTEINAVLEQYVSPRYILALVGFGLDGNMVPPPSIRPLLHSFGAGPVLDNWVSPTPGSEGGDPDWWTMGVGYLLVGMGASSSGDAIEQIASATWAGDAPVPTPISVDVYFYRQSPDGPYTLGLGD